ncbi:hypothetical protein PPACK8108_LOCUS326 [Phakopsora pachyrhizi]|uniref:Uncharacterized protein n=1 Tax=Phakopsora pachyrhizi TaxID=170000 RepID=A0AAV0AFR2_PHAPC|nr:hypothetical protein PPACK8108_LOCUS326 [Phakopsora pachyrhizi]
MILIVQKDETNHTVDDPQNIANSVCSAFQRATKSVGIATPTYYANLVATRAKNWDISDENVSTVFTTNNGTQNSGERHCEFDYFKKKIDKMNEKFKLISHQMKKNALLPDGFSWKKNSQPPEEYSKQKFTLASLNNMIARVKCCECPNNEDDKIYPLQPPRLRTRIS